MNCHADPHWGQPVVLKVVPECGNSGSQMFPFVFELREPSKAVCFPDPFLDSTYFYIDPSHFLNPQYLSAGSWCL